MYEAVPLYPNNTLMLLNEVVFTALFKVAVAAPIVVPQSHKLPEPEAVIGLLYPEEIELVAI